MDVFIARQPVFDREERLAAFELLYGTASGKAVDTQIASDDVAGSALASERLLLEACLGTGLDTLTEGLPALLPVSKSLLLRGTVRVVHPRRVVLRLARGTDPTPDLMAACAQLQADGYRFAVDAIDALRDSDLLRFARLTMLDTGALKPEFIPHAANLLHQSGAWIMATHIPSRVVRDRCQAAGVELFQGYAFARADVIARRDLSVDHVQAFRLLNSIRDLDTPDWVIEDAFRKDLALTYKLLRLVNSAWVGGRDITTIGHAIRLVGREALNRWLSLLLISSIAERGVELEIANLSLTRARLCERIAEVYGLRQAGGPLFMVGLFSMLDTLLGMPMAELVGRLELAPDVARALVGREDFYGATLALVEVYEAGAWTEVETRCQEVGIAPDVLPGLYTEALQWARVQLSETVAREASNRTLRNVSERAKALVA
jgi:c-di-GMP phosphodiesterase